MASKKDEITSQVGEGIENLRAGLALFEGIQQAAEEGVQLSHELGSDPTLFAEAAHEAAGMVEAIKGLIASAEGISGQLG
jgi:hypothetical protein